MTTTAPSEEFEAYARTRIYTLPTAEEKAAALDLLVVDE